ncbi:MAG TPA: hypothetical protein VK571_02700 [Gemmatimonadaceae bacterium]|nr:hypothetical protein [Gemmatimonadaceae bacterium]
MNNRISQAYGYAVCFITVIVMLISIKAVVDAAIDLSDPIRSESSRMGRTLTNFEVYKVEARREAGARAQAGPTPAYVAPPKAVPDTGASDADLRRLYDAERETAIGNARFRATRSLIGNLLLIILAGALFAIHWRWLKRRDAMFSAA